MGRNGEKNVMSTIVKFAVASISESGQPEFGETQEIRLEGRREETVAQNIIKRDIDSKAVVLSCETVVERYQLPLTEFMKHATLVTDEKEVAATNEEQTA